MACDYVDVSQVKELFEKLLPWDKVKFLKEIKLSDYLPNYDALE